MQILQYLMVLLLSYLIGAIPVGLITVKVITGEDVRQKHSGRTGGTNAMRSAGFVAGFITAIFDILKGASAVWLTRLIIPNTPWLEVIAPILAIIGHNYSIFLIHRNDKGKISLGGGAGGSTCVGGAMGIWFPSIFILFPLGYLILFGVGYASVATLAMPLLISILFVIRAALGAPGAEWIYVLYGIIAEVLIIWSLRPNIKRLLNGTERLVGWRAKKNKAELKDEEQSSESVKNLNST